MQRRDTPWLIAIVLLIASLAAYHHQQQTESNPVVRKSPVDKNETTPLGPAIGTAFRLDIDSGAVNNPAQLPVTLVEGPEDQQALLKLDLSHHRAARIRLHYGPELGDWSLNIGDSRTNNGYSGDAGTQTHDSEIQIKGHHMSVWGSDVMGAKEGRQLQRVQDFVQPGQTVEFEISNQRVSWKSPQDEGELQSDFIFALDGQPEVEGQVNHDIYIGLGRVVTGGGRLGYGVASIEVECLP